MNKSKKLINDTIIYGVASFGTKFISFLLLPLYTSYFTSQEYGKWDLISTTISLVIPLVSFEILSAVYRWLLEEENIEKQKAIISTGFIYTAKNLIIGTIIFVISMKWINISNWILIIIMINLSILSDFIQKCIRGCGHNKEFALIGIVQTVINILTNIVLIYLFKTRLETFFIASIFSSVIGIIMGWRKLKFHKYISIKKYSRKLEREFKKYAVPMIPGAVNWWIMNVSDRYIISLAMGIASNGIYAISNKMPTIVNMITTIFNLAWQDNAIKEYKDIDRDKYYSNIFKYYSKFMISGVILLIAINRIIMELLVNNQFEEAWRYTNILYIGALFSAFASFWGAGYHGAKQTKIILKTTMLGAIGNIIFNLILIEKLGLYAASISTVIGYLIMWGARIFNTAKPFEIKIEIRPFIVLNLIMSLVLCLSLIGNFSMDVVNIGIACGCFIKCNDRIISKFINRMQNKLKAKKIKDKQNIYEKSS